MAGQGARQQLHGLPGRSSESEHEHIGDGKSDMEEGGGEGAKGGKESDDIYMDC